MINTVVTLYINVASDVSYGRVQYVVCNFCSPSDWPWDSQGAPKNITRNTHVS